MGKPSTQIKRYRISKWSRATGERGKRETQRWVALELRAVKGSAGTTRSFIVCGEGHCRTTRNSNCQDRHATNSLSKRILPPQRPPQRPPTESAWGCHLTVQTQKSEDEVEVRKGTKKKPCRKNFPPSHIPPTRGQQNPIIWTRQTGHSSHESSSLVYTE